MNRFKLIALAMCASFAGQVFASSELEAAKKTLNLQEKPATRKVVATHAAAAATGVAATLAASRLDLANTVAGKRAVSAGNAVGEFAAKKAGKAVKWLKGHKKTAIAAAIAIVAAGLYNKCRAQIETALTTDKANAAKARMQAIWAWVKANRKKVALMGGAVVTAAVAYHQRARLGGAFTSVRAKLPARFTRKAADVVVDTAATAATTAADVVVDTAATVATTAADVVVDTAATVAE